MKKCWAAKEKLKSYKGLFVKEVSNLAWIDMEMTGLDPSKDLILEVAALVTDKNLNILAVGPSLVIHQKGPFEGMHQEVFAMHTASGLLKQVADSVLSVGTAEKELLSFFETWCAAGVTPLCGNSIWQDRRFLSAYMPTLNTFFHYRLIDVSTVKELVKRWYSDDPMLPFVKKEQHRAAPDIHESVAELVFYRNNFFKP